MIAVTVIISRDESRSTRRATLSRTGSIASRVTATATAMLDQIVK